jgi:hypothetical protein
MATKSDTTMKDKIVPHIFENGSREHVFSYRLKEGRTEITCSEPNCEMNLSWGERVLRAAALSEKVKL